MNGKLKVSLLATILVCAVVIAIFLYRGSSMGDYADDQLIKGALAYSWAPVAEIVERNNQEVLIHCYEVVTDADSEHTATFSWLEINVETGEAKELTTDEVFNIYMIN